MPNVTLANGLVRQATRRRLMLAFNTPFFPEVLVASSVMAEGVDLHQDCRHVIHHDLAWNPSTLEQRTGRVDRIGSKAKVVRQPVVIYEPYLGGTHDEKMFRVVKDRERWFGVVMGETPESGERVTEQQQARVPLPIALAERLTMNLSLAVGIIDDPQERGCTSWLTRGSDSSATPAHAAKALQAGGVVLVVFGDHRAREFGEDRSALLPVPDDKGKDLDEAGAVRMWPGPDTARRRERWPGNSRQIPKHVTPPDIGFYRYVPTEAKSGAELRKWRKLTR